MRLEARRILRRGQPMQGPHGHGAHQRRGVVEQALDGRQQARIARVAGGDERVAHHAVAPGALDGRAGEALAEGGIVERQQLGQRRRIRARQRLQLGQARGLGELVPRAHGEAVVAAEHAVADRLAELRGDVALVLDRQVGDAAARIELVGRGERLGRADVEAAAAGAAMIDLGRIRLQLRRGQDGAEEQPRAELARHQIGVLALPAQPRRLAQRLFHQRRRVDEDLDVGAAGAGKAAGDALEAGADDVVIVLALGIAGDGAAAGLRQDR